MRQLGSLSIFASAHLQGKQPVLRHVAHVLVFRPPTAGRQLLKPRMD
jgi:hypothetical protein